MTLDEAIDENKELRGELIREKRFKKAKGVQLGNEALKVVQRNRKFYLPSYIPTLPGETRE